MRFFIAGTPVAQPRPKFARMGKGVRAYHPTNHPIHAWKALIIQATQNSGTFDRKRRLVIDLVFRMPRPASHLKKDGDLRKGAPRFHVQKPDLDNLAKPVIDAMVTAKVMHDDAQVVTMSVSKDWVLYREPAGVGILIHAI